MPETAAERYVGLMSGTSLDGIDGVIVEFDGDRLTALVGQLHHPYPAALRRRLLEISIDQPAITLREFTALDVAIGEAFADAAVALLDHCHADPSTIKAIGSHGQTMFHDGAAGQTLQMGDASRIVAATGIATVADFRRLDVALGGQGAPLVPAFHQALFGRADETVAVLNIGGISNLSVLHADAVLGFDCGPGNALLDAWCRRHAGQPYDDQGRWAASGRVQPDLLDALLQEPFFSLPPPKSTGRDLFNPDWLAGRLQAHAGLRPEDVQATLAELTARSCAADLQRHGRGSRRLIVCGGGALNTHLMQRLQALLPAVVVTSSAAQGLPPLQVEAAAFAWLARKALHRETGSLQSVTGARGARVLGAIYPA